MGSEAGRLISELRLAAHPEGGFYRETYRSVLRVATPRGERSALTSILFLLTGDTFSAFHSLVADETWHFYRGDRVMLELIDARGAHESRTIGATGPWQTVIPAGVHFAASVPEGGRDGYALVGCDVAPGFEFADFSLDDRAALAAAFPAHARLVERFTR